ncbi:hypothetical protein F1536_00740 [Achromobacter xylosoxidans]|uniref:hypothetical protein n=1 Tax=Alcaligenes xylosoxydans xylosoxydans TaxID=85698 RepID=UPI0012323FAF|nr:hypothetical protein [Achromobacter xylosoxidans]KAA5924251.1 hypothetical protein F1536_00740 [Achromobacter xylosoxidans]
MLYTLGKRLERMLFFGTLFSAVCTALLFFSLSVDSARTKALQEGLAYLPSCFDQKLIDKMEVEFKKMSKPPKSFEKFFYARVLIDCLHSPKAPPGLAYSDAYDQIKSRIEELNTEPPKTLINSLKAWSDSVLTQPTRFYDFEIPSRLAFEIIGNKITSPFTAVLALFKLFMGPILFFWLTGFLCTRNNELHLARSSPHYAAPFPHILNTFPLVTDTPRKKKSSTLRSLSYFHAAIRGVIILTLITCTVGMYIATLFISAFSGLDFNIFPIGALVATFFLVSPAIGCIAQEFTAPAIDIVFFDRSHGSGTYPG